MTARLLALVCCLAVVGCSAAPPQPPPPTPTPTAVATVRGDGVLLSRLGFGFAPSDFSVPGTSEITERVDQENTVVAVFTAPSGLEIASYLRDTLPGQGWNITADENNSLLFERGVERGAFTVTGALAALSLRWDETS
ncbi:hypothetical protein [Tessaracoccus sp.]